MIKGIDVSDYQSATYSLTGVDFVIVKATEGTSYVNPKHSAQVKRARDNGRVVGHYHFGRSGSTSAQVDYFLRHAAPAAHDILALDWEDASVSCAAKDAFLRALKAKAGGRKVLLYCNQNYWLNRDTTSYAADGLWIAQYGVSAGHPGIQAKWVIHQYTSSPLDTNVAAFGSREAMAKWAGAPVAAPALPTVDLSNVIAAAKRDPGLAQGKTTHTADVQRVEAALVAEKLLDKKWADGSFGTKTIAAYAAWQRQLGYRGSDADGIPGKTSLTRLGSKRWTVRA